jgi:peptide/nickel transport system substrate-binding protein
MDTPDKHTLILRSDRPRPPTVFDLFEFLTISDPQSEDKDARPSGTGPFQLLEWARGDHFKLTRNKNYWRAGQPYFDDLHVQIFADPQAMIVALEAHGIDAADKPPTRDELRLRSDKNFQLVANDMSAAYYCMSLNTTVPPLDNKLVRQALSYAADRKRMVDTALPGLGQPKFLPWPAHSPAYEATKDAAYPFDLDKARDLLQQANLSGVELELLYSAQFAEYPIMAQIYQGDLARLGITLKIRAIENGAFLSEKLAGHFQLTLDRNTSTSLNPDRGISGGFLGKANVQRFADPAYLSLIDQVLAESDADKRKPLLARFNDILVDEAFVPSLCSVPTAALASSRVRGLVYGAAENWKLAHMWLAA